MEYRSGISGTIRPAKEIKTQKQSPTVQGTNTQIKQKTFLLGNTSTLAYFALQI